MSHHGFITDQSRKARAARSVYEYVRQRNKGEFLENIEWNLLIGMEGVAVSQADKYRVLNLRLSEEHLSPYFKTDMNLFHMLMMDDTADMRIYKADKGWLFVFDGIPEGPKPFGQNGYDPR